MHNAFRKKDGSVRYTHIKVTRAKGYFTHDINGDGDNMYTADNICKMIKFLIDNIFVQFGGRLFRQVTGIPMGTNCAPLLVDLFLCSYENECLDNIIRGGHRRLARSFNLCYRYIDDLVVYDNKKSLVSSNIPSDPSYGVYIPQLIRYAKCCSHYDDFRYRHKCLV